MDRRTYLRTVGGLSVAGLAGCASNSPSLSGMGSRDRRFLEFGEFGVRDGMGVTTTRVHVYKLVAAGDPTDGSRTVWNPDGEAGIAVAGFVAEKPTFRKISWPSPASFHLRTTEGVFEARDRLPGGASVHDITWPSGARIPRPEMSGGDGVIRREWVNLYLVESASPDRVVTIWATTDPPYYWLKP